YHPELVRGGAQQVCYEVFEGLKETADVQPVLLAAVDESFDFLFKSGARITGFDQRQDEFIYLSRDYDHLWHKAGSPLLVEAFVEFLELIQPDVVHFHHFLQLGLDLLTVTRRTLPKARIVFTLHEFLLICDANGHMIRRFDGSLCTHASQVRCHQCFPDRAPEHFFMREMWVKRHLAAVDVFTVPSKFMIEHFVRWGLDRNKIVHVTNGQRDYSGGVALLDHPGKRNRFGFFGQLVDAKGVQLIMRAVRQLRAEGFTDFTIEINGDNLRYATPACREEIESFLKAEQELPFEQQIVVMNGSYHVDQLRQRMARIDWCIVPSMWWEIFALVISEAWMFGRPVICSNVGAMAERVSDGVDGLHFEMGDAAALARTIRRAATEDGLWERLHKGLPRPPAREDMINGFIGVYRGQGGSTAQATSDAPTVPDAPIVAAAAPAVATAASKRSRPSQSRVAPGEAAASA
ncbi:MAG TPA: glycosyltransferase, partial [Stellaceae bacterium]|nr:glycosyltransferase [Stellaceae bacterium]